MELRLCGTGTERKGWRGIGVGRRQRGLQSLRLGKCQVPYVLAARTLELGIIWEFKQVQNFSQSQGDLRAWPSLRNTTWNHWYLILIIVCCCLEGGFQFVAGASLQLKILLSQSVTKILSASPFPPGFTATL